MTFTGHKRSQTVALFNSTCHSHYFSEITFGILFGRAKPTQAYVIPATIHMQ